MLHGSSSCLHACSAGSLDVDVALARNPALYPTIRAALFARGVEVRDTPRPDETVCTAR